MLAKKIANLPCQFYRQVYISLTKWVYLVLLLLKNQSSFCNIHEVDYKVYHRQIYRAEALMLQEKKDSCLLMYKYIFTNYQKSFAKDCFNALQLACHWNKKDQILTFAYFCGSQGLPWGSINSNRAAANFMSVNIEFKKPIFEIYLQGRSTYIKRINWKLRYEVLTLAYRDKLFKFLDQVTGNQLLRDSLYKNIVLENMQALNNIFAKYGFPGEYQVGLYGPDIITENDIEMKSDGLDAHDIYSIMLLHCECSFFILQKPLFNALISGDIHPRTFAIIYERSCNSCRDQNTPRTNRSPFKQYNIYQSPYYYHSKNIKLVDENREEIGICPVSHDKAKYQFAIEQKLQLYHGTLEGL